MPAASLTNGPAPIVPAPPGWGQFPSGALPAVPRRHGLPGIGSAARTRRLQRQRRPASCRFRRGTRAHSGPARPLPRAQVVSGYPLLNTESALRFSILTRSTAEYAGSFTDHGTCDGFPAAPGWVNSKRRTARGPAQMRTPDRLGCTHPAAAAPAQAGILPVPARNTRSQRPCKAPPRAQVVLDTLRLNAESALRLSVPTPGTR